MQWTVSVLVLFAMINISHAATYYVATNGDNGRSCNTSTDINQPRQTISAGIDCLQGGGDTVFIRGGRYFESIDYNDIGGSARPSGNSWNDVRPGGSVIWIGAYNNEDVVMLHAQSGRDIIAMGHGDYIVWDHLHLRVEDKNINNSSMNVCCGRVRFQNSIFEEESIAPYQPGDNGGRIQVIVHWQPGRNESHFEFVNNDLYRNACCYSFYVQGAISSLLIENNRIYSNNWYGIQVYDEHCRDTGTICGRNVIIRNNLMYNNGHGINSQTNGPANGCAITMNVCGNCQIYNNLIYDNYCGIEVTRYSEDTLVANNTFYRNPNDGNYATVVFRDNTHRSYVVNNIIYTSGSWIVGADFGGSAVPNPDYTLVREENNTFSTGEPPGTEFVDVGARNFHLRNTSTGNIGSGVNLSNYFNMDKDGNARPASGAGNWDRGAYQFTTITPPPDPTPSVATKLQFGVQPSDVNAGNTITPGPTVQLQRDDGALVTTATDTVTLQVVSTQIPQGNLTMVGTDSSTSGHTGTAAIDGNFSTYWESQTTPHPHHIIISFPSAAINGIRYVPRDDMTTGAILGYEIYVSSDCVTWGSAVATGSFNVTSNGKPYGITFTQKTGNCLRLLTTSGVGGNTVSNIAELSIMMQTSVVLNGTKVQAATGGVATFSNLNISNGCPNCILQATSPGLVSQLSFPFTVIGTPPIEPPPPVFPEMVPPVILRFVPPK